MNKTITIIGITVFKLAFLCLAGLAFLNMVMGLGTGFLDQTLAIQLWASGLALAVIWLLALVIIPTAYTSKHLTLFSVISVLVSLVNIIVSFRYSFFIQDNLIILTLIFIYLFFSRYLNQN